MGAGKSAVARLLGERHGLIAADLDAQIEAEAGCSIAELFEREGEPAFRAREAALLRRALEAHADVLACGGGVVLDPRSRALLAERCHVVWLEVSPSVAARRIGDDARSRPLLASGHVEGRLEALLVERSRLYAGAAQRRVPTDGLSVEAVADAVEAALAGLD